MSRIPGNDQPALDIFRHAGNMAFQTNLTLRKLLHGPN